MQFVVKSQHSKQQEEEKAEEQQQQQQQKQYQTKEEQFEEERGMVAILKFKELLDETCGKIQGKYIWKKTFQTT